MITADQARALTESKTFEYHMVKINAYIEEKAKSGYASAAMSSIPTNLHGKIIDRLKSRGFEAATSEKNNETIIINW